jgi:peptidylprolyl isomerase/FKBP-type peptidyl-prolyl cis-trans isomerase FkpA
MKKNAAAEQNINSNNSNNFMIQGMKVEILKEGTGDGAKNGDSVSVNYTGTLTDGTPFDSSLNPGRTPFEFSLPGQVIQGWNLGLVGMKVGEKRKLTIPPELGYGANGRPPVIPANATLIFEIDMLSINGK